MRRAALAVLIAGFMSAGMISGPGLQPVAVAADLKTAANSVKTIKSDKKTVTFDGYAVSVPVNWPVYDLAKDPRRCVRYDFHAVYLGTPGPDQDCPPDVVGRVDTISIGATQGSPGNPGNPGGAAGRPGDADGRPQGPGPGRSAGAQAGHPLPEPGPA